MALPAAALAMQAIKDKPKARITSKVTTVLLTAGLGLGAFFGVRALIGKFKRNNRERLALQEGNPASFATQLKMAFENDNAFGWGTDEEMVYRILEQVPSASLMRKVLRAYKDLYKNNLSADLKSELSTQEYAIALEIINSKT
ncbi:hypothetical protein [Aquimarina mytili]|uniref:Annexin n=1 Tax=Aquimarina mytili TaxID=874423 RepID=A0A937D7A1_9FLAO|nr:hypothetical protein [Aquimarina mytili]MBL0685299.1 hypothetical protein [Aquimarina mytili]